MNAGQICDEAGRLAGHDPNTRGHRDAVLAVLNAVQKDLLGTARWDFALRKSRLSIYPDSTGLSYTRSSTYLWTLAAASWTREKAAALLGNYVVPAAADVGSTNQALVTTAFQVEKVAYADGSTIQVWVDPRYAAGGGPSTLDVRFRHYALPADFDEMEAFVEADRTLGGPPIPEVSPTDYRALLADWTRTALTPTWFCVDRGGGYPLPHWHQSTSYGSTVAAEPGRFETDSGWGQLRAPRAAATLAQSAVGGNKYTAGMRVQYRYHWSWRGALSEPSPESEIVITGSNNTVTLSALEEFEGSGLGRHRVIYRRVNEGPWEYHRVLDSAGGTPFVDTGAPGVTSSAVGVRPNTTGAFWTGTPADAWIRVWPLPTETKAFDLVYYRKASEITCRSDTPMVPDSGHQGLVHLVVSRLLATSNPAGSEMHQKLASRYLDGLARRELVSSAPMQRSMWDPDPVLRRFDFQANPNVTFTVD